jgi:hypothetical protein
MNKKALLFVKDFLLIPNVSLDAGNSPPRCEGKKENCCGRNLFSVLITVCHIFFIAYITKIAKPRRTKYTRARLNVSIKPTSFLGAGFYF